MHTDLQTYHPEEVLPGADVESDTELVEAAGLVRTTIFHAVGTPRMGQDRAAVVAPDLRVHGLTALRVADASIMPAIVSGHIHVPLAMIAEKAIEMILATR